MSDNISPATFSVIWDDLMECNDEISENELPGVREITNEEFQQELGFDPMIFQEEMPIGNANQKLETGTASNKEEPGVAVATAATHQVPETSEFEDVSVQDVHTFISNQENKNTARKTLTDVAKFKRYLCNKGERKQMWELEVDLLDEYVASYILSIKRKDGSEYEPVSLRGVLSSLDRELRKKKYPYSIMAGKGVKFSLTRDTYTAKTKSLKKQGKGNRPNEAEPLTNDDISALWEKGLLGDSSPAALVNTIWLNNSLHFGMRGTMEQYNLRWGDIRLNMSPDGTEYLDVNERQTKTRTGENIADVRKVSPKMFATGTEKCLVLMYKKYANIRPTNFSKPEDPFYLAPNTKFTEQNEVNKFTEQNEVTWYKRQRIGQNKLGNLLKDMAKAANLPGSRKITNHSARKHLVQKLRNNNIAPTEIMAVTGHKNVQSIINYSSISVENQRKCSNLLAGVDAPVTSTVPSSSSTVNRVQLPQPLQSQHTQDIRMQNIHQQLSHTFSSQFYGATFHIENFHIHN